jgi:hypothetical protein
MKDDADNPFDPNKLRVDISEVRAVVPQVPRKIKKRRLEFAMVPMTWYERLEGASGQTYRVAWYLCYLDWKVNGKTPPSGLPIKLASGMLKSDGVSHQSKCRALRDLERRGLITVEWWSRKSPVVRLMA